MTRSESTSRKAQVSQESLFLAREYEAIVGKRSVVFWTLYAIVLVSLAAVAIGRTGIAQLQERMDDPFTSWMDIPAQNLDVGGRYPQMKSYVDSCARSGAFNAIGSSGSHIRYVHIWSPTDRLWNMVRAQSFSFWKDRKLLDRILLPDNVIEDFGRQDLHHSWTYTDGVIVTQAMLEATGLAIDDLREKKIPMKHANWSFPVSVLAVVRNLPSKTDLFCEHALMRGIMNGIDEHVISTTGHELGIALALPEGGSHGESIRQRLAELLRGEIHDLDAHDVFATHTHRINVRLDSMPFVTTLTSLQSRFDAHAGLRSFGPLVLYQMNYTAPDSLVVHGEVNETESNPFERLSITFEPLDSIRAFQRDFTARFGLELDLASVRSKENFATVSRLSEFLITALVLFAGMSILLFLYNLLKNHLERIKMNLGTFLAFGLSEGFLLRGYLRIIMRLLIRVMALAMITLLAAQGLGILIVRLGVGLPSMLANLHVATNAWLYITIALLLSAAFLIFRWQLKGFLANTPGDLIYARK